MCPDGRILNNPKTRADRLKQRLNDFIERIKTLQGDPHYVAVGMAVGVFVAITPTIPFHTAIALVLAFLLRGSKAAAVIAVWISNPVTIPFFYVGSYKVGNFILGNSIPFDLKYKSLTELAKLGASTSIAMLVGGVILGIVPGIAAYFITRKIFTVLQVRIAQKQSSGSLP